MIDEKDILTEIIPKHPLGGQQVTLTSSGVKITHIPSGITAFVDIGRSQFINKKIAMEMIESAITHPDFRI